jgi:hypothetical protein
LQAIRARDVAIGRSEGYLPQQFYVNLNPLTLPFFLVGLHFYFFSPDGSRYRVVGWIYLITLALFGFSQGRFYYMAPAYPMLLAGGAVRGERWLVILQPTRQKLINGLTIGILIVGGLVGAALALPIAPVNSALWEITSDIHDNFSEQIGWEEMAQIVAEIYDREAPNYVALGILTGNYGEAAAINLYGPRYGLPTAISPVNSYWLRGYGSPGPDAALVLGFEEEFLESFFAACTIAGKNANSQNVANEESLFHPDIFLCERPLRPWGKIWPDIQSFG